MIMVTGATGHIGNVLVRKLLSMGKKVRIFAWDKEDLKPVEGLDIEITKGDLGNLNALVQSFEGVDTVYHLAGMISIVPGKYKELYQTNVEGTKNVIKACLKTGVRRLVYVSSIHAIKEPPRGTTITEDLPFDKERVKGDYAKTKAIASYEVLAAAQAGMDAVIACPTGVIGPFDYRVSEMGQLVLNFIRGKFKISVKGAYDFVDVRDVARGLILISEGGKAGEKYILSGHYITVTELLGMLADIIGKPAPVVQMPVFLARVAGVFATPFYKLTGSKPLFTAYSIDVLNSNAIVSSEKARHELGYTTRPIRETLEDAVYWFSQYIKGLQKINTNRSFCPI